MRDLNQMGDTFFDFSSLKNGEHVLPPDDDELLENEEEYDALNDETFGDLEDTLCSDDWEEQHEQFAKNSSTVSKPDEDDLRNSLRDLVLRDVKNLPEPLTLTGNSVWSYTPPPKKNGEVSILSSLQKASQTFVQARLDETKLSSPQTKICTVEELERNLIKSSKSPVVGNHQQRLPPPPNLQPQHHFPLPVGLPVPPQQQQQHGHGTPIFPPRPPMFQGVPYNHMMGGMNRFPPGMPPGLRPNMPPPGYRMPPHLHPFMQRPPHHPPHYPYPMNAPQQPIPPHLQQRGNMPMMASPNRNMNMLPMYNNYQQQQANQQQLQIKPRSFENSEFSKNVRDEYEGMMTQREKQWLLNIQLVQLNTGTPYFDDYYYTIFKEKKANESWNFENVEDLMEDVMSKFQNVDINATCIKMFQYKRRNSDQHQHQRRNNNERQDNQLTPRVYTPLQFENSLGKLQCMSVTAPRKIIDTDVVNCEKDGENMSITSRDLRKTKQLLLELEMMYTLFLKAEDLTNPVAIENLKVLRDIKLKQRFKEIDAATTPEQKQEIVELIKKESKPQVESPNDFLQKILSALLQDDKFASYMNIRKGKLLLLRLIPVISESFFNQFVEIWSRLLMSLALIGRRDTAGDNLLPKFYPLFKRYIQSVEMADILENIHGLTETNKLENSRSTPLSHQGKQPLYFVLMNKFGISAMTALLVRCEYLISNDRATEKQQNVWFNFVLTIGELLGTIPKVPLPLEGISVATFAKICQRIPHMSADKKTLLGKYFVEIED